jgi:hypothetical protein
VPAGVTLYLPGVLEPPAGVPPPDLLSGLRVAALERLLARAERVSGPAGDPEAGLFTLFGLDPAEAGVPAAAVARLAEDPPLEAPAGWWLRADPVHLRPDLAKLILFDAGSFALSLDDARRLARAVAPIFEAAGAALEVAAPARWYLRLERSAALRTRPLSAVLGQDLRPHLASGRDARRWQALLTEVEMTLFADPVNQEREARGEPPLNGLWLWGGGVAPERAARRWAGVQGDDALARGLARLTGGPAPPSADGLAELAASAGEVLLYQDGPLRAVRYGDPQAWREALAAVEERWVAPTLQALAARAVTHLTVLDGAGRGYRLTRSALRRWWRRPSPLAEHLRAPGV